MISDDTQARSLVRAALSEATVSPTTLTEEERRRLDDAGFVVLVGMLDHARLTRIGAQIEDGLVAARGDPSWSPGGTLHLSNLFDYGPDLDHVWTAPRLLAAVHHLLGDDLQVRGLHYRGPQPGFGAQLLHQDFVCVNPEPVVNGAVAVVALSQFSCENGATRVVPGSHRTWGFIAPSTMDTHHPEEEQVPMPAGSMLVMSGNLWHSGVRNRSSARRDALQIRFERRGTDTAFYPEVSSASLDRLGQAAYLML